MNYFNKLQCQYVLEDWLDKYESSDLAQQIKLKILLYRVYELMNITDKKFMTDYLRLRQSDSCLAALSVIEGFKADFKDKKSERQQVPTVKEQENWISII